MVRAREEALKMSQGIATGTDVIREMLRVRNKRTNFAILARDLGLSSNTLDAFIDAKRSLPIPVLQGLTKELWNGHAVYDPEVDRLRPALQEPAKPLGALPSLTIPLPTFTAGPAQGGLRPVKVQITEPDNPLVFGIDCPALDNHRSLAQRRRSDADNQH